MVVLAVSVAGDVLSPLIIFEAKCPLKDIIHVQEDLMDSYPAPATYADCGQFPRSHNQQSVKRNE